MSGAFFFTKNEKVHFVLCTKTVRKKNIGSQCILILLYIDSEMCKFCHNFSRCHLGNVKADMKNNSDLKKEKDKRQLASKQQYKENVTASANLFIYTSFLLLWPNL